MCGINLSMIPFHPVSKMNDAINHRGLPGMEYEFEFRGFGIGHVRLPILGLDDRYNQPYETQCGDWTFAFNGELFNYKDFSRSAQSDVEVLSDFFEKMDESPDAWEWNQLKQFDGFWSIVAWNRATERIYVVTDFLAKKPLYIHAPTLTVSSELRAFKGLPKTINRHYFAAVGKWGYCPKDLTPFNEIQKIPRGLVMEINPTTREVTNQFRYLDVVADPNLNIRHELEMAVQNRLVSDVPISVLLSGGVDSSIIYKLMEKETHDFTIFHIKNGEDSAYLKYLNIPDDIDVVNLDLKVGQDVADVVYANESPVDLGSMLPQYRMAEAIKDAGFKVCITGDGADEVFGGYRRQFDYDAQYSDIFEELVYYHLPRLDKMSMYFTTELRSPFLSLPVIQAGLALPYEKRINKNGLKEHFTDLIPKEILYRRKHPLKSKKVLEGNLWRYALMDTFIEKVANELF